MKKMFIFKSMIGKDTKEASMYFKDFFEFFEKVIGKASLQADMVHESFQFLINRGIAVTESFSPQLFRGVKEAFKEGIAY